MRRVCGAVAVMLMIGVWNWIGARSLRVAEREPPPASSPVTVPSPVTRVDRPAPRAPSRASAAGGSSFRADPLAFLSTAPADSLDLLPGVGPVLAGRIIDARARGSFRSWDDVLAIKGIGPVMVARWRSLAGQ